MTLMNESQKWREYGRYEKEVSPVQRPNKYGEIYNVTVRKIGSQYESRNHITVMERTIRMTGKGNLSDMLYEAGIEYETGGGIKRLIDTYLS